MNIYNQTNPIWGKVKIGQSKIDIAHYGCTLTTLAQIATYLGKNINPKQAMEALKFTPDGLLIWQSINPSVFGFKFDWRDYKRDDVKIKQHIKDPKKFVILKMDFFSGHWVWAVGNSILGGYNIIDPLRGDKSTTRRYQNKVVGACYFTKV